MLSISEAEAELDLLSISEGAEAELDSLSISEGTEADLDSLSISEGAEAELDLLSISEAEAELDLLSISQAEFLTVKTKCASFFLSSRLLIRSRVSFEVCFLHFRLFLFSDDAVIAWG